MPLTRSQVLSRTLFWQPFQHSSSPNCCPTAASYAQAVQFGQCYIPSLIVQLVVFILSISVVKVCGPSLFSAVFVSFFTFLHRIFNRFIGPTCANFSVPFQTHFSAHIDRLEQIFETSSYCHQLLGQFALFLSIMSFEACWILAHTHQFVPRK